ncbi:Type II secretion system (T2SS), protein F [Paraoerskovia marina]|uniref:Type II secretion system (T2SS), protein F n=1 Tax=Paraoerskovia marina TaxID=545619 RepID=A0A1H1W0Z7_9CELL|nr:type II secretion system F family protein [Paraoerskovia marina]SDS90371.1 Type II secretion system (T2SS), protein F [Paraoerskovia marina]
MSALVVAGLVWLGTCPWWLRTRGVVRRAAALGAPRPTGSGPDVGVLLELLGAALRAGASLPRAFESVGGAVGGPEGEDLADVAAVLMRGGSWTEAWDRNATGSAALAVVAEALRPAWEHGAAPADALRVAQAEARRAASAEARAAAGRLGVHLVLPLGVCYLPAFVLVGVVPVLLSFGARAFV